MLAPQVYGRDWPSFQYMVLGFPAIQEYKWGFLLYHSFHTHEKSFHGPVKGRRGRSIHLIPSAVLEKAQEMGGLRWLWEERMNIRDRHWHTMTQQNTVGQWPVFLRVDLHFHFVIITTVWVSVFDSLFRYVAQTSLECAFPCPCLPTGWATVAVSAAVLKHSNTNAA